MRSFASCGRLPRRKGGAPDQKPPVAAVITESENEATVSKDVVRVKAVLKIELLKEGWNAVPLRLADAAITAATIAGQPARIVAAGGEGYKLLVEKKGKNGADRSHATLRQDDYQVARSEQRLLWKPPRPP